jgi:hypothetical protein
MCRVNHEQSFLKDLAKELRQDPALLRRGLGLRGTNGSGVFH